MSQPSTPILAGQPNNPKLNQIQQKLLTLKLKRINELNTNLKDLLNKDRIYASNASYLTINYVTNTKDYTIPEVWGSLNPGENPFRGNNQIRGRQNQNSKNGGGGDGDAGCCSIM
ncbi:hypothetical protein WICPIJ_003764 [Wickerhamomyces pijperi]|uniref:Guanine nucleotide-binding protein subunit gamma n=1 Tax=Wickerhamomyces pijperi TaxID=599730 RepID=A0A9P8Q918_WICPI|nr:hypothetical protein WICPIJ_003764 [Wickerhamomyces pijperi]